MMADGIYHSGSSVVAFYYYGSTDLKKKASCIQNPKSKMKPFFLTS
jgi:hypothetical protein